MKKGSKNPHLYKAKKRLCIVCESEYRAIKDNKNYKQKYCSKECWNKRARLVNNCGFCSSEIVTSKSINKKYCNLKCRNEDYKERMKGDKSHFWLGGKTRESKLKRTCAAYKEWRAAVFARDNFTCVFCGVKDRTIEADHIKAQSEYPELIYKVNNGRTLCHECHKETDNYGYKQRWKD